VVSVPGTNTFAMQSDRYRDKVLTPGVPLLVIEAGASLGWRSYVGPQIAMIGVDAFGASAPGRSSRRTMDSQWRISVSKAITCSGRTRRDHDARRLSGDVREWNQGFE
jgi:transketolase